MLGKLRTVMMKQAEKWMMALYLRINPSLTHATNALLMFEAYQFPGNPSRPSPPSES
jgi:hypothetical protein